MSIPVRNSVKQKNLLLLGYENLEHWLNNPQNLYIGRRGRIFIGSGIHKRVFYYPESKWANPYKLREHPREDCIILYTQYLYKSGLINQIDELLNKNIGCFCDYNERCHTEILINLLRNKYPNTYQEEIPVFDFS